MANMNNNRLFNTIRNVSWRFLVLLTTAVANLLIPRYIILIYGSEVNGLTSSIAHVLAIVNLIQAGIASSTTYLMYKPIGEQDRVTLGNIIKSAKRIYRYISLAVSVVGVIASFFFAYVVKTDLRRDFILIASLVTCLDSAVSTYFTAVANIFLNAKQDGYLVSRISIFANIVGYILKILIIIFKPHYLTLFLVNIVVCLINIVALTRCFKRQYKPFMLTPEEARQVHYIPIRGVSYAAANEVAHALINGSVSIIISTIAGLKAASVFSVYLIAVSFISTVSNAIYSAVVPSFGSVAAENNVNKTNQIFEIYQFVLFTVNAFMYMCAAYLLIPFVKIYTQGVSDAEYTNYLLMIFIILFGVSNMIRIPYNNTVYIKGLFKETYLQAVICSGLSVVLMIVLTKIDYTYTILGSVFFFMSNALYQHFKLPRLFDGFDNSRFWNHLAVIGAGVLISISAYFIFPLSPSNFLLWFFDACITGVISLIVLTLLLLAFDKKSLKLTYDYFISRKKLRKGRI